jgi:hypothetical protein
LENDNYMAKLTTKGRDAIKAKNFALPGRRYPIEDASHARNALARVSQHGDSEEKTEVRAKVHAKYPGMGGEAHSYRPPATSNASGYGHESHQRHGSMRTSGRSDAHRIGKR